MHHHYRQKHNKNFGHPILEIIADINGVFGGLALYPQLIKLFQTRSTEGLSLVMVAIILVNSSIWLYYAMSKRITPLRVSSMLHITAATTIIVLAVFIL